MMKKPTKRSGSSKPSKTEGETTKPVEAAAQSSFKTAAGSAAPVKLKRPKASPGQTTAPVQKRYRRNIRDSIYLYLEQVKTEERLGAALTVERPKGLH